MKWLTDMSNTSDADVPKVFSTSYGEDEASWSMEAATRMNTEFMKAGARGITLLYVRFRSKENIDIFFFFSFFVSNSDSDVLTVSSICDRRPGKSSAPQPLISSNCTDCNPLYAIFMINVETRGRTAKRASSLQRHQEALHG